MIFPHHQSNVYFLSQSKVRAAGGEAVLTVQQHTVASPEEMDEDKKENIFGTETDLCLKPLRNY